MYLLTLCGTFFFIYISTIYELVSQHFIRLLKFLTHLNTLFFSKCIYIYFFGSLPELQLVVI